jgi:hypothetical protein
MCQGCITSLSILWNSEYNSSSKHEFMKMNVICDVAKCSLVEINRRFGGAYCLQQ